MADLTKVGTSLLNMPQIEEYLNLKGFAKRNETVEDVKNVAGEPANTIAIAVSKDNRTTVNNALHFNGKELSDFVMAKEGAALITSVDTIHKAYNSELIKLRDELYQIRQEAVKNGLLTRYNVYDGYYDTFRSSTPTHLYEPVATSIEDSRADAARSTIKVLSNLFDNFVVGDHLIIRSKGNLKSNHVTIVEMMKDHQTIRFSPETDFVIEAEDAEIYRSKGSLINGSYVFGELIPVRPGTKELFTSLDDDTHWTLRKIKKDHTGFAYTFRIPTSYQRNYLAKLQIKVKKYGQPGPLKCYIINEKNVTNWKNPDDARDQGILIAESIPLQVDARLDMHLAEFTFFDPNVNADTLRASSDDPGLENTKRSQINANPMNYPLLTEYDDQGSSNEKVRYCMIIEGVSNLDEQNYYELVFLGHTDVPSKDLQLNNVTYEYTQRGVAALNPALVTDEFINASDIYYGVTLLEAVKEKFIPYADGMYTAQFRTNEDKGGSKARLMLRVGREGMFTVSSNSGTPGSGNFRDGGTFTVRGEDAFDIDGFYNIDKKPIVIGKNIREVQTVNNNSITVKKGLHIYPNDPVYPVGYTVYIKAKKTRWNPDTCVLETQRSGRYPMPLVDVVKDGFKLDNTQSDRLIFEAEFKDTEGNAIHYNEFELEITWEKSCRDLNTKLVGKIDDLVVSIDDVIY